VTIPVGGPVCCRSPHPASNLSKAWRNAAPGLSHPQIIPPHLYLTRPNETHSRTSLSRRFGIERDVGIQFRRFGRQVGGYGGVALGLLDLQAKDFGRYWKPHPRKSQQFVSTEVR